MGVMASLLNLGIRVEEAATQVGVRFGKIPLQWPSGVDSGIIHRLSRDPHDRASMFAEVQPIVVNEGETAVVLQDGKAQGALEPGRYVFERPRLVGVFDILWIKIGQRMLKWGMGNVVSADGIQISGNGVVYVKVVDGVAFNSEVVQGASIMVDLDLQRFLMPQLQGVLRSTVVKWGALEIQGQRESFTETIRKNLDETFARLGIGIVGFEVIEINLPPEFKEIISRSTLSLHQAKAELIQAQTRAQVTQIEAAGVAQAQILGGMAQVQLMAAMQEQGFDPMKLKALEALNTFAATPSVGGLMGGDQAKTALFGQLAAAALSTSGPQRADAVPPVPASVQQLLAAEDSAHVPEPIGSAPTAAMTPDEINRQIDALTERLVEGKISEDTFNKLVSRLEAKLARLSG